MYNAGGGDALIYFDRVTAFVKAAKQHAARRDTKYIYCPCTRCKNLFMYETPETIREHLLEKGFVRDYFIWTKHGERQTSGVTMHEELRGYNNKTGPNDASEKNIKAEDKRLNELQPVWSDDELL